MTTLINGVLPILHTPFTDDDRIDLASFQRQIDWAFSVGADGVCIAMTAVNDRRKNRVDRGDGPDG